MDALGVRIILNGLLVFGLLVGAVSLFLQKKNGLTKAMAWFTLFACFHVGMLIPLGFIDVCQSDLILSAERIVWNFITFGWILSGLYLAYKLIKSED